MAANGLSIKTYFRQVLEAALTSIDEYNDFVRREAVPRPDLDRLEIVHVDGNVFDENRLGDIHNCVAEQFFQRPEDLETWIVALSARYGRQRVVREAIKQFKEEQARPSLWTISDETDNDQFVFTDPFLRKTISVDLRSFYRLDAFTPLNTRISVLNSSQDRQDFEWAKCIVISRSGGDESVARDITENILSLASVSLNGAKPRIIFTAGSGEQARALEISVRKRWAELSPGRPPPFLFLIPSEDESEVATQFAKARVFLTVDNPGHEVPDQEPNDEDHSGGKKQPPPAATENDLVILVGGRLTTDGDALRFGQLTGLLGDSDRLLVIQPWSDGNALEWIPELEHKLGAAKRPLLVEFVGESRSSTREVAVFYEYLLLAAASRPGAVDVMARLPAILASASGQRLIWNPSGAQLKAPAGAEISLHGPVEFAPLIQRRLGLAEDAAPFPAYVAVEEVIVDNKADSRLRRALKRHLSIVAGGTGEPPSTDSVVPFLFQLAPDKDPIHLAVESFLPSGPNIVAACDASRGGRTLKQYLTDINARIRVGVNKYVKETSAQAPDCILRIVVMIDKHESKRLDSEFRDSANGSWRIIKFKLKAEEYEPDHNDIELTKAWVNEQLDDAKNRGAHDPQGPV